MSGSLLITDAILWVFAMTGAWWIQRKSGNSGWIDVIWTLATGLIAAGSILALPIFVGGPYSARAAVIAALLALWSQRLGGHILARTRRGVDDPRYAALILEWGEAAPRRLFLFLQVQALAGFLLTVSALAAAANSGPFAALDYAGLLVAVGALMGEAVADAQLRAFGAKQRSGDRRPICEDGLWGWSRHPNYFFEFLFWCALPLFAFSGFAGSGGFALAFIAPAMMYWLLAHVSGVPPLEAHMARSRGAQWEDYCRRVSVFFPLPPKPKRVPS